MGSLRMDAGESANRAKKIDYNLFGNIINDDDSTLEIPFNFQKDGITEISAW